MLNAPLTIQLVLTNVHPGFNQHLGGTEVAHDLSKREPLLVSYQYRSVMESQTVLKQCYSFKLVFFKKYLKYIFHQDKR